MFLTSDGACNPNPGAAGIGVALHGDDGSIVESVSRSIGEATNNIAEYEAVLEAFRLAYRRGIEKPDVRSDSKLVVSQAAGDWLVNDGLRHLCQRVQKAMRVTGGTLSWIPREENTVADALSKRAIAPNVFAGNEAEVRVQIERALLAMSSREHEIERVSRYILEALGGESGSNHGDVNQTLSDLTIGRGPTSTMVPDVARFSAGLLHGKPTVQAMEEALVSRSPATQLKALRWAARGLAPILVAAKLQLALDYGASHLRSR